MKKQYWYLIGLAVVTVLVLATILVSDVAQGNSKFDKYSKYTNQLGVVDWTISESTAQNFADSNCEKLAVGDVPAIRFRSEDHVKSSAAIIAAYCPDSFDNFVAGVITDDPEYKDLALYINEKIRVEGS